MVIKETRAYSCGVCLDENWVKSACKGKRSVVEIAFDNLLERSLDHGTSLHPADLHFLSLEHGNKLPFL